MTGDDWGKCNDDLRTNCDEFVTKQDDCEQFIEALNEILMIWRRLGAIRRQFGLIWVECVAKKGARWRHVAFQCDSGQIGTSGRRFLAI